jgi:hypothetical protein
MRNILFCSCFLFLLAPAVALAQQDYPRGEVFFGYSYFRAEPEGQNLNGWEGSVTGNITRWFGIEGDFAGHYGRPKDQFGFIIRGVHINQYTFMGGPKLILRTGRVSPFVHALIGGARAGTNEFGLESSQFAMAAALGGGVDLEISKYIAIRPVQADYLVTRFDTGVGDDRQNNFRYSAGIVFRF